MPMLLANSAAINLVPCYYLGLESWEMTEHSPPTHEFENAHTHMCWVCLVIGVSTVLRQKNYQLESKKSSSVVEEGKEEKINVNLLQFKKNVYWCVFVLFFKMF